jgi:hypothetical protein
VRPAFSAEVDRVVGPILVARGFVLDEIDDRPDAGGRERGIVYYRSDDCKIQVYYSSREGETNVMIAPVDAINGFGLNTPKWRFLGRFAERPHGSLHDIARMARLEYESYADPLEWVRDRVVRFFDAAHAGILAMDDAGHTGGPG